jgi:WD40 repeat protein
VENILEDYALAFGKMPPEWREQLKFWEAFFRERAHILRRGDEEWPADKILLQLAMVHADDSPVTQGAERFLAAGQCDWPWLRRERRPEHVGIDRCLAILEGHTDSVDGAMLLPDGRILSWDRDKTLRLWDQSGKPLAVLEGHTSSIYGALALSDGRLLSWSEDKTLRLWDQSGKPLTILEGHTDGVFGALALPDGRLLSWSRDQTLRMWDQDGKPLSVLKGHISGVNGVLVLSDGRILSRSYDNTLRLWDQTERPLSVLESHADLVYGTLALPDGQILSWSYDKTIRLSDRDGKLLIVLKGHTDAVWGALALPDGRLLSYSRDFEFKFWDKDGKTQDVDDQEEVRRLYQAAQKVSYGPKGVYGNAYLTVKYNSAILAGDNLPAIVWHGASRFTSSLLYPDGQAVVIQANDHVCVLQLYQGNRPITFDELEPITPHHSRT